MLSQVLRELAKEYKGRWKGPAESDPCPHDSFNVFLSIVSNYRVCKF